VKAGFELTVYNRTRAKAEAIGGAKVADTPKQAVANAPIVLSMVGDDEASRAMWLGENGALAGVTRGATLVECSTLTVDWVLELAQYAENGGCELIDAPVTGSKIQAAAGELNFLVGGSDRALERVRPALAAMSKSISHLGPTGSGARIKLINNFLCGVELAGLAEAIAMIEQTDLDRTKALDVLLTGAPGSPLLKTLSGRDNNKDHTPNFYLRWLTKDLTYAAAEAEKHSITLETAKAALKRLHEAIDRGYGDKDMSSLIDSVRTLNS